MNPELTKKAVALEKEMEDVNEFIELIGKSDRYMGHRGQGIVVIRPSFSVSLFGKFVGTYNYRQKEINVPKKLLYALEEQAVKHLNELQEKYDKL